MELSCTALNWFKLYLQYIFSQYKSEQTATICGVPQGSVLGLAFIYMLHSVTFLKTTKYPTIIMQTGNTQIYITINPDDYGPVYSHCHICIRHRCNSLKLTKSSYCYLKYKASSCLNKI